MHQSLNLSSFHTCYHQRTHLQSWSFATLISVNCIPVWIQLWLPCACGTRFLPDVSMSKKGLANYVTCKKTSGLPYDIPDPPPLPKSRIQQAERFTVTGVDFTGTLYICEAGVQRKVYICLFTYATTWAVHLEVFTNWSVQTFLLAYRRFAARKSAPQQMISDNASPYLTAAEELTELFKSQWLKESLRKQGLNWQFIP